MKFELPAVVEVRRRVGIVSQYHASGATMMIAIRDSNSPTPQNNAMMISG
jgi:hypothetical protein